MHSISSYESLQSISCSSLTRYPPSLAKVLVKYRRSNMDVPHEDPPPPYSEHDPRVPLTFAGRNTVRLQNILLFRLAIDYNLLDHFPKFQVPSPIDYEEHANLCFHYTRLISDVATTSHGPFRHIKDALDVDVFNPATSLKIPNDVMEFQLFYLRIITHNIGEM